ncbi:transcriptional regulator [Pigmentiphaga sp. H8]|uniref:ArsR/SmtB family transcription factor n=1 Tax=Pigmentiphaga sp. H8 TaxID=2488560 RepID=UPI000F5A637E|nr:metalloregulator ArsR/SmtB family transcription factor [Pigmentiphaga sp. H8]AZG08928.1 transcriptional regulator [Pigmentiphaga sp. H8]
MVEYHASSLDRVFHALADPTRREMLRHLAQGERKVGDLAAPFTMSLAAASKHLKVLEGAGLVRRRVQGRLHFCQLEPGPLADAQAWLSVYERFWNTRLDALQALLEAEEAGTPASSSRKQTRKGTRK